MNKSLLFILALVGFQGLYSYTAHIWNKTDSTFRVAVNRQGPGTDPRIIVKPNTENNKLKVGGAWCYTGIRVAPISGSLKNAGNQESTHSLICEDQDYTIESDDFGGYVVKQDAPSN